MSSDFALDMLSIPFILHMVFLGPPPFSSDMRSVDLDYEPARISLAPCPPKSFDRPDSLMPKLHRSPGFTDLRQWACWQTTNSPQGTELTTIKEAVLDPLVQLFPVLTSFQQMTTVTSPPKPRLVTISPRKWSSKRTSSYPMTPDTLDVANPGERNGAAW